MTKSLSNVDLSDLNSIKHYIYEESSFNVTKAVKVLISLCVSRDTSMMKKIAEAIKVEEESTPSAIVQAAFEQCSIICEKPLCI